jgi:putative peptidoglycan lipid II flippase
MYRPQQGWLGFTVKIGSALAVMAGVLLGLQALLPFDWQAAAWQRALALTLLIVAGGASYFIALFALGFRPRQFMRREQ